MPEIDATDPPGRRFVGPVDDRGRVRDAFDTESDDRPILESAGHDEGTWLRFGIERGKARPEAVLAPPDSARASLYALLAQHGPSPVHSPRTLAETAYWVENPGIDDPSLEDLRHLPFVSIDEPHSRDLDQAVHVAETRNGFHLRYAIADAAHFVRAGSALFAEALGRGATVYLPGLVVPMLPEALSEDWISINPEVDRRALVFDIRLDRRGRILERQLQRARVRSRLKTSYEAVQHYYDGGALAASDGTPVASHAEHADLLRCLDALAGLGAARLKLADERNIVQVRRRELSVRLTGGAEEGDGFVAMSDPRYEVERFNEQISLLCNVEGARFLAKGSGADAQPVFRFHQPPDAYRLRRLERQIRTLAKRHRLTSGGEAERWVWHRGRQSLADYLARLPADDGKGPHHGLARALHRQVLLAGGRSGFDSAPGIHHGVGAEVYARFTAPMREVVGIFVHKETWEQLGLVEADDPERDEALRERVVEAANRSKGVQRKLDGEVNRRVLDQLLGEDRSHSRERAGVVLGISRSKVHVQLDDPPIDVKVYHRHLEEQAGHRLSQGRDGVTLRQKGSSKVLLTVGDAVRVAAVGHDAKRDRWKLRVEPLGPRDRHDRS